MRSKKMIAECKNSVVPATGQTTETNRIREITELYGEIGDLLRISLQKAMQIGKLLTEQKASMKHGEFMPWLRQYLQFISDRTARRWMGLYRHRDRLKMDSVSDLTQAYRLLEMPKATQGHATVDIKDVEPNPFFDMSCLVSESIKHWTNAIAHIGLYWITAVRACGGKYQNICDHNRFAAIKMLGIKDVPVVIVPQINGQDMKDILERFDYQEAEKYKKQKEMEAEKF